MRQSRYAVAFLAAVGLGQAVAVQASEACRPERIAVQRSGDRALVDIAIDGRSAHMVLDTGASQPLLLPDAPQRLGLPIAGNHPPEQRLSYGKPFEVRFARARHIAFAGLTRDVTDLPVASGAATEAGVDGFFSDGRLRQADFDLAHDRVELYCDGVPAWTRDPDALSVPLEDGPRPFGEALVNGQPVRVLFDTGSPISSMTLAAAARTGVSVAGAPDGATAGVGMAIPLRTWTARIGGISLGGRIAHDVAIQVVDKPNASADLIAGFDFFLRHRVWIDQKGRRLVVQATDDAGVF